MSRTSYRQTLVSPGKLKVIHSVITWSVSESVSRHLCYRRVYCALFCVFTDSYQSMSNQPALWTPNVYGDSRTSSSSTMIKKSHFLLWKYWKGLSIRSQCFVWKFLFNYNGFRFSFARISHSHLAVSLLFAQLLKPYWKKKRHQFAVHSHFSLGFLDPELLLFGSSSSSVILMRLSGPRSRPNISQKMW
jgi:hypothetical protein